MFLLTDHSAVCCSFTTDIKVNKGPNFWKFNNALLPNTGFNEKLKSFIQRTKAELVNHKSHSE